MKTTDSEKAQGAGSRGGDPARGKKVESVKNEKGVSTPSNQAQIHHDPAIKDGGGRDSNPSVLCPECHKARHR